jgi:hypothetical protein
MELKEKLDKFIEKEMTTVRTNFSQCETIEHFKFVQGRESILLKLIEYLKE